jgi:hypothetical protein
MERAETFKDASVANEFHAQGSVHEDRTETGNGASNISMTKIVASATRRGYAGNGQLTVFSTVSIL